MTIVVNTLHDAKPPPVEAVVIGASAGGVEALLRLLSTLPASFGLPVITVLHIPQRRDSQLAAIFRQRSALAVHEPIDKEKINPGTLYFAGPDYHLSVEQDKTFSLSCEAPVNYSRPSIDLLMTSAAEAYGSKLAGIVLTGANEDGAAGLASIRQRGGYTVVQDPAQSQATAMPLAAIRRLQPCLILGLDDIHGLLLQMDHQMAQNS